MRRAMSLRSIDDRVQTLHPDPAKSAPRIDAWKYEAVRGAILAAVPRQEPGLPFGELPAAVRAALPPEELDALGSVGWYTTVVKLDLEARGELQRSAGRGPQRLIRSRA